MGNRRTNLGSTRPRISVALREEFANKSWRSEQAVEVIAEKRGPAYIVWEGNDSPGLMDEVVIVRPASNEGYRYRLGSLLAWGFGLEPSADAPSAEELVADVLIIDYMWLAQGTRDRRSPE